MISGFSKKAKQPYYPVLAALLIAVIRVFKRYMPTA